MTLLVMSYPRDHCLHHVMPLALSLVSCSDTGAGRGSHDADGIVHGATAFLRSR